MYRCSGAVVYHVGMARLTITLSDERHQQLRIRAARRGISIASVIESDLQAAECAKTAEILAIVEQARLNAEMAPSLDEDEMMELATLVSHTVREEMAEERQSSAHRP